MSRNLDHEMAFLMAKLEQATTLKVHVFPPTLGLGGYSPVLEMNNDFIVFTSQQYQTEAEAKKVGEEVLAEALRRAADYLRQLREISRNGPQP